MRIHACKGRCSLTHTLCTLQSWCAYGPILHAPGPPQLDWVEASNLEEEARASAPEAHAESWRKLQDADGILVPGGFGARGVEGKILAAKYARLNKVRMRVRCGPRALQRRPAPPLSPSAHRCSGSVFVCVWGLWGKRGLADDVSRKGFIMPCSADFWKDFFLADFVIGVSVS